MTSSWSEVLPDGTKILLSVQRMRAGDLTAPVYQRPPDDRRLRLKRNLEVAGGFNPILGGVLLAFYRSDGRHALADGMGTQWMAIQDKGEDYLLTILLVSADPERELPLSFEQKHFEWLNQMRLKLSPADDFQSLLSVHDKKASEILDVFAKFGITLARRSNLDATPRQWANLAAVNEVVAISERPVLLDPKTKQKGSSALSALDLLEESLQLQDASWGLGYLDGQVLAGTSKLLAHPYNALHCDRDILAEVMDSFRHPKILKEKARDVRNGKGAGIEIARHLKAAYNRKIRGTGKHRLKGW